MKKILFMMMLSFTIFTNLLLAEDIGKLASQLNLYAGTKASIQWERIFSSEKRMRQYQLYDLQEKTKNELKTYLITHAADSEQPVVPGL